ncbi:MAG: hypothetical protein IIB94_13845, partial [Candidatus Marinimicrobia bacterium]|nr:hypothetical protein [Candidatus Neomarinimicrobiota bacterium]
MFHFITLVILPHTDYRLLITSERIKSEGEILFRFTLIISATVLVLIGCGGDDKKKEAA